MVGDRTMKKLLAAMLVLLGARAGASEPRFADVEALGKKLAQTPWERRGQVSRAFKSLGPGAFEPLLALVESHSMRTLPSQQRSMVVAGALEALGALRDRRAASTFRASVDSGDETIARAGAEGLGMLGGPDEERFLIARAVEGDARERAAIAGLGRLRSPRSATYLASRLDARPSGETARALAEAMGLCGSSWAWEALGPTRNQNTDAVREPLAASLAAALPAYEGYTREALEIALLAVDHPSTPNRLAQLRVNAAPALAADLQNLERHWLRIR
jgi:hypothetical protein